MLFNSLQFLAFFPVVTALFLLCPRSLRWVLLLAASCAFYMAFIPAYILVLFGLIIVDYLMGILIEKSAGRRRTAFLVVSILATCSALFVFKYQGFFAVNASALAGFLHWNYRVESLNWILPLGLSFHTFQSLSYVIEVYRGKQAAERHLGFYSLYVMFYPQLVAGPIERPGNLLPQVRLERTPTGREAIDGIKLMAWGMFQKVVVADRLAPFVNAAYADPAATGGSALLVATLFFAFQIYCDFAGYSDIARGAAHAMGFRITRNFNAPYLAESASDFWARWHISLSSWFRDYLYIPLGGNRGPLPRVCLNLLATFLVCGLWHGAKWTFVLWGTLNGAWLALGAATLHWRERLVVLVRLTRVPHLLRAGRILLTFTIVCAGWVFFRADTVPEALLILRKCAAAAAPTVGSAIHPATWTALWNSRPLGERSLDFFLSLGLVAIIVMVDIFHARKSPMETVRSAPRALKWTVYAALVLAILFLGKSGHRQFIYFQF